MEKVIESIKERIERWIILSEQLEKEGKSIYIKDIHGSYFYANIVLIGEEKITLDCFGPEQRKGEKETIRWIEVIKCVEYEVDPQ